MRRTKDLSPSERHVVDYIFSHLDEAANIGIVELSEKAFTSTTTVKRLCRKLGIESYTDFRVMLAAEVSNYNRSTIIEGAKKPVDAQDTMAEMISKVSDQNAKSIIDTAVVNRSEALAEVVKLMRSAGRIDFYGVGSSYMVASDAQLKCMRLGIPSCACNDRVSMMISARTSGADTLAFLISYSGEAQEILEVANALRETDAHTVSLTSFSQNTLSDLCGTNLFVQSLESWDRLGVMSGRIASLNMMDILFTALVNTDPEHYNAMIDHTNIHRSYPDTGSD